MIKNYLSSQTLILEKIAEKLGEKKSSQAQMLDINRRS